MINTNIGPGRRYWAEGELTKIENYDKAIADTTQVWDCHHRVEIQNEKVVLKKDLIAQGLYYHRPAEELIFLTHSEHVVLHKSGKYNHNYGKDPWNKGKTGIYSEETKQKISNTLKGNIPWNKGKKMSEAYKESCKKGWITRKRKSQK